MLYDFLIANISRFLGAECDAIETAMVEIFIEICKFYGNEFERREKISTFSIKFCCLEAFNQRPLTMYP